MSPAAPAPPDGVVAIASVQWDYLKIAPQQTMRELGRQVPVLYVERPRSLAGLALEPAKALADLGRWWAPPRPVAPGVHAVTPFLCAPFATRSLTSHRVTAALVGRAARRGMTALGMRRPVLWLYVPQGGMLAGTLGEAAVVYDVIDEFSAFPNQDPEVCRVLEDQALAAADLVYAISPNLVEDRAARHPRVEWCPIGAEVEMFLAEDEGPAPAALADLEGPVVGYYGGLDQRLDQDLCFELARRMRDVTFAYFGPIKVGGLFDHLSGEPNVVFPGPIPYEELGRHARRFDVCHLPYTMSRFNQFIFPNKIFEYLASGPPVVSTPIPALAYLGERGVVALAGDADGYEAALRAALAEGAGGAEARRQVARENTWAARAERMWRGVCAHLEGGER